MTIRLMLLISTTFAISLRAWSEPCDRLLVAYQKASEWACEKYQPELCGDNIFRLVSKVAESAGESAISKAKVHYIFNRNFDLLRPLNTPKPVPGWKYHVVLETENGIYDFDSSDFIKKKSRPIPLRRYVELMFGDLYSPALENIVTVVVPARDVLREVSLSKPWAIIYQLAYDPKGWVDQEFSDYIQYRGRDLNLIPLLRGKPSYFILSADGYTTYPPQSLVRYLSKP